MNAGGLCSNSRQCIKKRYPENRIYGDSNFDTYESQEIDLSYYKNRENLKNIIQFTSETSSNSDNIWNNLSLNESKSGNNYVVFESSTKNKISEVKLVGNTELQNGDIEISFYDNIPQLQDSDASSLKRKNSVKRHFQNRDSIDVDDSIRMLITTCTSNDNNGVHFELWQKILYFIINLSISMVIIKPFACSTCTGRPYAVGGAKHV